MKNDKIKLKIIEQDSCDGCFFDGDENYCNYLNCSKEVRQDGRNVIFKEVKE